MLETQVHIRQSGLGNADKCLRSFQLSLEKPEGFREGGSVQRAMGTGYHAAQEMHYQHSKIGQTCSLDDLVAVALNTFHDEVAKIDPAMFKWSKEVADQDMGDLKLTKMVSSYFEGGHRWDIEHTVELTTGELMIVPPYTVLAVEATFGYDADLEIRGVPVRGAMDLVLEDASGWITIVDHKTAGKKWDQGKHRARKQNQPPFYIGVAEVLWPGRPGYRFVYDIMTYKGEFERRPSDVRPEHVTAVFEKAQQVLTLYKGMRAGGMDLPVNPSSNLCSPVYCDFWTICSQGAALD